MDKVIYVFAPRAQSGVPCPQCGPTTTALCKVVTTESGRIPTNICLHVRLKCRDSCLLYRPSFSPFIGLHDDARNKKWDKATLTKGLCSRPELAWFSIASSEIQDPKPVQSNESPEDR